MDAIFDHLHTYRRELHGLLTVGAMLVCWIAGAVYGQQKEVEPRKPGQPKKKPNRRK